MNSTNEIEEDKTQITLTRHLIQSQQNSKEGGASDIIVLLSSIQTACKFISSKVRKNGLSNLMANTIGTMVNNNQKSLDQMAHEMFVNILKSSGKVGCMVSPLDENVIQVESKNQGNYIVAFDPIDGTSNIDANISVGTIFCIWRKDVDNEEPATLKDCLQSGETVVAAGYCIYGSCTQMVISVGEEVNCFTLDTQLGEFLLTSQNIQIPQESPIYSINEGNATIWDEPIKKYVHDKKVIKAKEQPKEYRYVGSMVADCHRTILHGGIFMYPKDKLNPTGKLRLLYEVIPLAYIVTKAGGKAISGKDCVLKQIPENIHQTSPIILGSLSEVEAVEKYYGVNVNKDKK